MISGTSWMNWSLAGSVLLGFVLLFLFPARYRRTDIDVVVQINDDEKDNSPSISTTITERPTLYE